MKSYEILDAIGGIDTKYIENAARTKKHAPFWSKAISAAACLCLLAGAAIYFKPAMQTPPVVDITSFQPVCTTKAEIVCIKVSLIPTGEFSNILNTSPATAGLSD